MKTNTHINLILSICLCIFFGIGLFDAIPTLYLRIKFGSFTLYSPIFRMSLLILTIFLLSGPSIYFNYYRLKQNRLVESKEFLDLKIQHNLNKFQILRRFHLAFIISLCVFATHLIISAIIPPRAIIFTPATYIILSINICICVYFIRDFIFFTKKKD